MAYLYITGTIEIEIPEIEGMNMPQFTAEAQAILLIGVGIIDSIIILLNMNTLKNKRKIIILSIIQVLFGAMDNFIGGVITIILLCTKTKDIEEKKEKIELPELVETKFQTKQKVKYAIIWILLFFIIFTNIFINIIPIENITDIQAFLISVSLYVLPLIIFIIPMKNDIKNGFKALRKNLKTYIRYILPKFGIFIISYIIITLLLTIFIGEISSNQAAINELPIGFTIIAAIILAPLVEELIFRGMLKKIIGNNRMFIILSALLFGLVHVLMPEENWILYLHIIPYSLIGYFLAKIYSKTSNIALPIFIHMLWNTFGILVQIFILLYNSVA